MSFFAEECAQTIQDYLSLTAERILDLANTKRHELRKVVYDVLSDKHSTYEIDEYGHRYPIEMVARYETDFIDADHELPDEIFNHFCQIMRQANENAQRVFQSRLAEGVVEMDHIPRLFKPGQHAKASTVFLLNQKIISGTIRSCLSWQILL